MYYVSPSYPASSIVIKMESFEQRRGHQVRLGVITSESFLFCEIFSSPGFLKPQLNVVESFTADSFVAHQAPPSTYLFRGAVSSRVFCVSNDFGEN